MHRSARLQTLPLALFLSALLAACLTAEGAGGRDDGSGEGSGGEVDVRDDVEPIPDAGQGDRDDGGAEDAARVEDADPEDVAPDRDSDAGAEDVADAPQPQDTSSDPLEDAEDAGAEDTQLDALDDAPADAALDVSDDAPPDAALDVSEDAPEDTALDASEDGANDASFDVSEDATADADVAPDVGPATMCSATADVFVDAYDRRVACVFVAPDGSDEEGAGTAGQPWQSIGHAVTVASNRRSVSGDVFAVAIAGGVYRESVSMVDGVSLFGGFDPVNAWSRGESETLIEVATVVDRRVEALTALNIDTPTWLDGLGVRASAPEGAPTGTSVIAVRVVSSRPLEGAPAGLELRDVDLQAGPGVAGASGQAGAEGARGVDGVRGADGRTSTGDTNPGGVGGVAVCGGATIESTRGGDGGTGGGDGALGCGTYRENAGDGRPPVGVPTCSGGGRGDACSCVSPIDYNGESGRPGNVCGVGTPASGAAAPGTTLLGEIVEGVLVAPISATGGTGAHGVGGSGGGGGGSGCNAGGWGRTGGGGGGGGSGGCGGRGGAGGGAGGSSIALLVVDSDVTLERAMLRSSSGGSGGRGGIGGQGGDGGAGVDGGSGGYSGGRGGDGQSGGAGGPGAGGVGGSSIAVVACESSVRGVLLDALSTGDGGAGGAAAVGGAAGPPGLRLPFYDGCSW